MIDCIYHLFCGLTYVSKRFIDITFILIPSQKFNHTKVCTAKSTKLDRLNG